MKHTEQNCTRNGPDESARDGLALEVWVPETDERQSLHSPALVLSSPLSCRGVDLAVELQAEFPLKPHLSHEEVEGAGTHQEAQGEAAAGAQSCHAALVIRSLSLDHSVHANLALLQERRGNVRLYGKHRAGMTGRRLGVNHSRAS